MKEIKSQIYNLVLERIKCCIKIVKISKDKEDALKRLNMYYGAMKENE